MDFVGYGFRVKIFPDDFPGTSYFEEFGFGRVFLTIAADDGIPVLQSLGTAGIGEAPADIVVGKFPDDFAGGIEFDDAIAVRERDERVPILETDRGKRPHFRFAST